MARHLGRFTGQIAPLCADEAKLNIESNKMIIDDSAYVSIDDLDSRGNLDEPRAGLAKLAKAGLAKAGFGRTLDRHSMRRRGG